MTEETQCANPKCRRYGEAFLDPATGECLSCGFAPWDKPFRPEAERKVP